MVKFLEFEKELHKQDSNSKGNLPQDKIDRLEKIGVDWGNSK